MEIYENSVLVPETFIKAVKTGQTFTLQVTLYDVALYNPATRTIVLWLSDTSKHTEYIFTLYIINTPPYFVTALSSIRVVKLNHDLTFQLP